MGELFNHNPIPKYAQVTKESKQQKPVTECGQRSAKVGRYPSVYQTARFEIRGGHLTRYENIYTNNHPTSDHCKQLQSVVS